MASSRGVSTRDGELLKTSRRWMPRERPPVRSITPQLLSPDDACIPRAKRSMVGLRVISVDVNAEKLRAERLERSRARLARTTAPAIDGFLLLEAAGVEFPDEAHRADVSGYGATTVTEGDLDYFPRLASLDASDNGLRLEAFAALPRLKELRLACNQLRAVEPCSMSRLVVLDLSYNALTLAQVTVLAADCDLPALKELDLTANDFGRLPRPDIMAKFVQVERLSLERNGLDDECLTALCAMPALADLSLAHNQIRYVPALADLARGAHVAETAVFAALVGLGLAHNSIGTEEALFPLTMLPKLEQLALYGNPLFGLSGETLDRARHLANFDDAAVAARDGWTERALAVSTTAPQRRPKRGSAAAAKAARFDRRFRALTIATVDESVHVPRAQHFKEKGRKVLNTKFLQKNGGSADKQLPLPEAASGRNKQDQAEALAPASFFATQRHHSTGLSDEDDDDEEEPDFGYILPSTLAARSIEPNRRSDPAKLRSAINALRFALDHPLTAHTQVPTRRGGAVPYANRPTAAFEHRKLPRRPFKPRENNNHNNNNTRGGAPFSAHVASATARRAATRQQEDALAEIETVLDTINANLLDATAPKQQPQAARTSSALKPGSEGEENYRPGAAAATATTTEANNNNNNTNTNEKFLAPRSPPLL